MLFYSDIIEPHGELNELKLKYFFIAIICLLSNAWWLSGSSSLITCQTVSTASIRLLYRYTCMSRIVWIERPISTYVINRLRSSWQSPTETVPAVIQTYPYIQYRRLPSLPSNHLSDSHGVHLMIGDDFICNNLHKYNSCRESKPCIIIFCRCISTPWVKKTSYHTIDYIFAKY